MDLANLIFVIKGEFSVGDVKEVMIWFLVNVPVTSKEEIEVSITFFDLVVLNLLSSVNDSSLRSVARFAGPILKVQL